MSVSSKVGEGACEKGAHVSEVDPIDPVAERRLVRKLDFHIVPLVMLLNLFSFLDRVNIGNARLYGLEENLGLKGNQYQLAVSILFVTYVLFEVPSNLVIKKLQPSRYIAFIATAWGIVATLTGLVQSYGSLIACRLILGTIESGLFPGLTVYLTMFYTRRELALRVGYLFVSAAIAGAFGGLLAYAIGFMDGLHGLRGWRWIMIIEGIPSVVVGISLLFLLADDPTSARYLTAEEKELMIARRASQTGHTARGDEFHWADVRDAFTDWKTVLVAFAQFGVDTMLYGYSTFLPTIIEAMGEWSTAETQALTIPCYALGAVTYILISYASDRTQKRGLFAVLLGCVSIVGYGVLMSDSSAGVHYFGCFLVAMGLYVVVGIPLAWLPSNCPRYGKRTTATGMQLTFGNISGIMAPFLYPTADGPRYLMGHAVTLSLIGFSCIVYTFMTCWLSHLNRDREQGVEDHLIVGLSEEEISELGDKSPRFVYTT
ncbi:MFS transporter [Fistulina hepatica ATCC 64428]|nr:MFS transporter [Fistulina hepatica ATCC 64428]